MVQTEPAIDWRRGPRDAPAAARGRLPWLLAAFAFGAAVIIARLVQLETATGAAFRAVAAQPIFRERAIPADRGRILSREGSVLAEDQSAIGLNLAYRWLQNPPSPVWLRSQAKARLPRSERSQLPRLLAAEQQILETRRHLHQQLAQLAGLNDEQWQRRLRTIQQRVELISRHVNARRQAEGGEPVTVAEELREHWICDLNAETARAMAVHIEQFPGAKLIEHRNRVYPQQSLAAAVVGYTSRVNAVELLANPQLTADDRVGRYGVEVQNHSALAGAPGLLREQLDHGGASLASTVIRQPRAGDELQLTIDVHLQRQAEMWLDAAVSGQLGVKNLGSNLPVGGAAVVMDVATGELLVLASSPRFDPNWFSGDDSTQASEALRDPARPLWNRAVQMALPPGSVFKTLTAIALLEEHVVQPNDVVTCRGYLHQPDQLRCAIFRRQGIGHGDVNLSDALMQSCNVFFFHFAEQTGPGPLVRWADRLGFGKRTGIDLPGESSGTVPAAMQDEIQSPAARSQATMLAIGQGQLTATPLQVARLMAALASGGKLPTPHVVEQPAAPASPVVPISPSTLRAVRQGLERVVSDPRGTAHATVQMDELSVAGKTGTAETGGGLPDHAWFAGYAPAAAPTVAIVVVLEHGGSGGEAAGPVAKQILQAMQQRGYFGPAP